MGTNDDVSDVRRGRNCLWIKTCNNFYNSQDLLSYMMYCSMYTLVTSSLVNSERRRTYHNHSSSPSLFDRAFTT